MIRTLIRHAILSLAARVFRFAYDGCGANFTAHFGAIIFVIFLAGRNNHFSKIIGRCQSLIIRIRRITLGVWQLPQIGKSPHCSDVPCGLPEPCSGLLTSVEAMEETCA
jgi:hypothetical protein